jgi:hypothetical protein
MLWRWQNSSCSRTSIDSPVSFPFPGFAGFLVTLWRCLSPSSAAEKNGMRRLWSSVSQLLRQAQTARPRSVLWRQTGVSRLPPAQSPVFTVREREERTAGLAGRQSAVHQAVRLLRGPTLSADHHQGSGGGTLPRLACRQGVGQAVHARTTAPGREPCSTGDWHRRDRHCQGAPDAPAPDR